MYVVEVFQKIADRRNIKLKLIKKESYTSCSSLLIGNQGRKVLKWVSAHFNFERKNFCFFRGVTTTSDTLSTSRSVGWGLGIFIYALSADETGSVFVVLSCNYIYVFMLLQTT